MFELEAYGLNPIGLVRLYGQAAVRYHNVVLPVIIRLSVSFI